MDAKRALVVFYSRTGTTKKVAEAVAGELGADLEELIDLKSRGGPVGFALAAKDAALKKLSTIADVKNDPTGYDLVVVGTPVWADTMCCSVRTYLTQQREHIGKVAFFLTTMRSGAERTFRHMEKLCGKAPAATLGLRAKEVRKGAHLERVRAFAGRLRGPAANGRGSG